MTTYISFVHNERFTLCKTSTYTVYRQTHFDATTVTRAYSTTAQGDLKDQFKKCWKWDWTWWLDITTGTCTTNYNIATNYDYHTFLSVSRSLVENICWLTASFQLGLQGSSKLAQHPTLAILFAIQGLLSFAIAHAEVQVPDTLWKEPGVLWLAMPTGKTILVSDVSRSNLFNATWCLF